MRRMLTLACLTGLWATALAAEELPRNPFWAFDYEGIRYPITLEPRFKSQPKAAPMKRKVVERPKAPNATEEERAREAARLAAEERLWTGARTNLHFGATMGFSSDKGEGHAITINDRIYTVGNFISCNCDDKRFTWKIEAITSDGKIKLSRVKYSLIKSEQKKP